MSSETLGNRLRRLRKAEGLSQDALGRLVGVTGQAIHLVERGRTQRLLPDTARNIAEVLHVPEFYLLTGQEAMLDSPTPPDVTETYLRLGDSARRAWLQVGRTLQDLESDLEAEERSRRAQQIQAEHRDPIDEEPLAADTGEDLRRAQRRQREGEREK